MQILIQTFGVEPKILHLYKLPDDVDAVQRCGRQNNVPQRYLCPSFLESEYVRLYGKLRLQIELRSLTC